LESLRQGLHVVASWDYHRGAKIRDPVRGNPGRFIMVIQVDSPPTTRCLISYLGTLSLLEVVIPTISHIEIETCFIKWLPVNLSPMLAISFGMRLAFAHTPLLVVVTMHRTSF
jgi:hypothetical protein